MKDLTGVVAQNIEHYRKRRRISRTGLARLCTEAGLPTRRPALTELLDGRRQTVSLQELVALAIALDVTVTELIVPLHSGESVAVDRSGPTHAFVAAQRLFGAPEPGRADHLSPYLRYTVAAERFERANSRLANVSHRIAEGRLEPHDEDGRPHPASEILAAEAALSRLQAARTDLAVAGLVPPPTRRSWRFLDTGSPPDLLPVLEHLSDIQYPLVAYVLRPGELPSPVIVDAPLDNE